MNIYHAVLIQCPVEMAHCQVGPHSIESKRPSHTASFNCLYRTSHMHSISELNMHA